MTLAENITKLRSYLKLEQHLYQTLFDLHPDAIYVIDIEGYLIECNKGYTDLTGYQLNECIGEKFQFLIHPDDQPMVTGYFEETLSGHPKRRKFRIVHKSGKVKNVCTDAVPFSSEDGETLGIFVIGKDITEENELRAIKEQQEERFRSLIQNSFDFISVIGKDMDLLYQSPSIENALGYKYEEICEVLKHDLFAITNPNDIDHAKKILTGLFINPGEKVTTDIRFKHKNGEWRSFNVIGTNLLDDPNVQGIVVNYQDISEIKKAQEEVHYMAFHDYLTDLPNRRYLEQKLESELERAKENDSRLAVMFIDLDQFKFINDTLGHDIGDKVLIEIAKALKSCVWENDVVARLAGDEFIILVTDQTSNACVEAIANRIKTRFEQPVMIEQLELFITASIGISLFPDSGTDSKSLMKNADLAMYLVKENGKNGFQMFTPTMNIKTYKTFALQNDLRKAINENQFELYYQPKVCVKTNIILGAEALIRWHHPEWGMVSPAEFIFLAEESGLVIPIGKWVLKTVCRQIKSWEKKGYEPIKVSLNFSVLQILQSDIVHSISSILEQTEIDGNLIEIEITESMILEKETEVAETIDKIQNLGVGVALDDFGTGFSSLASLRNFSFETIKLDKAFIRDIHVNSESRAIIQFIINLAKQLNINVVAEGVEHEEQLTLLRHLDCNEVQGYLFSRPKPVNEFERFLIEKSVSYDDQTNLLPDKRNEARIAFPCYLEADMTIVELNGKDINLGKTNVLIEDIGANGLRFISDIKLSLETKMTIQFTTQILGQEITTLGKLIYQQEQQDLFRYGVEFIQNEEKSEEMTRLLNALDKKLLENTLVLDTSFIETNITDYFIK
ncbi:EAL domain-containing protein [Mesobacillus maritimus]|uniref:EAL domain-containing protein n=1 Tax=Mesobacillus maritimus TaxID=1643336 RepID=UPI0038513403